jgi:hypothetical protein
LGFVRTFAPRDESIIARRGRVNQLVLSTPAAVPHDGDQQLADAGLQAHD